MTRNFNHWKLFSRIIEFPRRYIKDDQNLFEIQYDTEKNQTQNYDEAIAVVRRGTHFFVRYEKLDIQKIDLNDIKISILNFNETEILSANLGERLKNENFFQLILENSKPNEINLKIFVNISAEIGLYSIEVTYKTLTYRLAYCIYVIFNPFDKEDQVFFSDSSIVNEHLLKEQIKIYVGSSNYNHPTKYLLDQFSIECIFICAFFIGKISKRKRSDPIQISREFSAFVNGNDENGLVVGSWFDDIHGGVSPTEWTRALEIFEKYLETGRTVKYGQCFIFAMLLTSLCRNIGIVCRAVSGFNIAHDTNQNGIVELKLDYKTLEPKAGSETLWNFHAWNNVILRRNDINLSEYTCSKEETCWQHLDGTPQDQSEGIYRCGPYPLELLRKNIYDPRIPYDGSPVYHSINYQTVETIIGKSGKIISESSSKDSTNIILTTDSNGHKQNIIHEYKLTLKPPSVFKDAKFDIILEVPVKIYPNEKLSYKIKIKNATKLDTKNRILLTADLINGSRKFLLNDHIFEERFEFEENFLFDGKAENLKIVTPVDLSMSLILWQLTFYQEADHTVKKVEKTTSLLPCLLGNFLKTTKILTIGTNKILFSIKNLLDVDIWDIIVAFYLNGLTKESQTRIERIGANEEIEISSNIFFRFHGKQKVNSRVFCRYYNGVIAKTVFEV